MNEILIIKTGLTIEPLRETTGDFEDWIIHSTGLSEDRFRVVSVFLDEALPDLEQLAAIIVTGSPDYVSDREPWSENAARYLKRAVEMQIPVLGICYGHQLLAHSLGGEVGFHPLGREIGTVSVQLTEVGRRDALLGKMPDSFLAHVSHQQSVLRLPNGAEVLAVNEFEPHHSFRFGDWAWGVQFHPEFSAAIIAAYIHNRQNEIKREGLDPVELIKQVEPAKASSTLLAAFANLVSIKSEGIEKPQP